MVPTSAMGAPSVLVQRSTRRVCRLGRPARPLMRRIVPPERRGTLARRAGGPARLGARRRGRDADPGSGSEAAIAMREHRQRGEQPDRASPRYRIEAHAIVPSLASRWMEMERRSNAGAPPGHCALRTTPSATGPALFALWKIGSILAASVLRSIDQAIRAPIPDGELRPRQGQLDVAIERRRARGAAFPASRTPSLRGRRRRAPAAGAGRWSLPGKVSPARRPDDSGLAGLRDRSRTRRRSAHR